MKPDDFMSLTARDPVVVVTPTERMSGHVFRVTKWHVIVAYGKPEGSWGFQRTERFSRKTGLQLGPLSTWKIETPE